MKPGRAPVARALLPLLVLVLAAPARAAETAGDATPETILWAEIGDEAARLLSGYIRIDTTNPPGNELPGAEYLKRFFEAEGIEARVLVSAKNRGNVVARLPATEPAPGGPGPILLLSHIDVVPAEPAAWSFPPLSGAIEGGSVHGRGALDDKGHGVVHALALALLARQQIARSRDVVFCATAAEEAGTGGADWMVANHWDLLGPPAVVWNEGGVSTASPLSDEVLLNAIATTEKRALWLTLVAEGEGGHGSTPVRNGANEKLLAALARIADHETPLHVTATVAEAMRRIGTSARFPLGFALRHLGNPIVLRLAGPRLTADRVTNALVRDTIALTGLRSGVKHNVIPRRAEAMLDVRLLPDTDAAAFLAGLEAVIDDPEVAIEGVPDPLPKAAPESPPGNELFLALQAEMEREIPGSLSVPMQTTGGTDSVWFRERGVPSYGYVPAVLPSELVSTMHGVNERVPIAELERAVRVTYRTLVRLARPR